MRLGIDARVEFEAWLSSDYYLPAMRPPFRASSETSIVLIRTVQLFAAPPIKKPPFPKPIFQNKVFKKLLA